MTDAPLILASASSSRRAMLEAAGVTVEIVPARIDEAALKEGMTAGGASPRDIADMLAETKALRVARRLEGGLVLGGDQLLVSAEGAIFDKPVDKAEAKEHLQMLSGKRHQLISAAVIAEHGRPVWRDIGQAVLEMRTLSDSFIDEYVESEWEQIRHCVGCYRIESRGAQLFTRLGGDNFTIMGMPLLSVLAYLRTRKLLPS